MDLIHAFTNKNQSLNTTSVKLNIDDLYETKKQRDLRTLAIFNKILQNIHNHIQITARKYVDQQYCWYAIPAFIFGMPKYNVNDCVVYIIDKLRDNKFLVTYTHPNLLFISWKHWIPEYVRHEIKKKTGIVIDELGNVISDDKQQMANTNLLTMNNNNQNTKPKTPMEVYKNVNMYKPTGTLVYNNALLNKK